MCFWFEFLEAIRCEMSSEAQIGLERIKGAEEGARDAGIGGIGHKKREEKKNSSTVEKKTNASFLK